MSRNQAVTAASAIAAAPKRAATSLLERLQGIRIIHGNKTTNVTAPCLCVAHKKESCGAQSRTRRARVSARRRQRARVCPCQSHRYRHLLVRKELSFVVASLSIPFPPVVFHVSSRSSPVPSLALRMGSNDHCDGNQCCPSFGGSLSRHHQEWSLAAQFASTRENSLMLSSRSTQLAPCISGGILQVLRSLSDRCPSSSRSALLFHKNWLDKRLQTWISLCFRSKLQFSSVFPILYPRRAFASGIFTAS